MGGVDLCHKKNCVTGVGYGIIMSWKMLFLQMGRNNRSGKKDNCKMEEEYSCREKQTKEKNSI